VLPSHQASRRPTALHRHRSRPALQALADDPATTTPGRLATRPGMRAARARLQDPPTATSRCPQRRTLADQRAQTTAEVEEQLSLLDAHVVDAIMAGRRGPSPPTPPAAAAPALVPPSPGARLCPRGHRRAATIATAAADRGAAA
jgi:hypothetical protein